MQEKTVLNIKYSGDALLSGKMGIQELAPALLALDQLLQESNRILNPSELQLVASVQSDFKSGSFEVFIELAQTVIPNILSQEFTFTVQELCEILGLIAAPTTLIKIIKALRKRKINKTTKNEDGSYSIEINGDNNIIVIEEPLFKLLTNNKVLKALLSLLKPLKRDGIDEFCSGKNEKTETVSKTELDYFERPEIVTEDAVEYEREALLMVDRVDFEEGFKWRFHDGDKKITAAISQEAYESTVNAGDRFGKGDVLKVRMLTSQVVGPKGIKNEHTVLKVLEHQAMKRHIESLIPGQNPEK